MSELKATPGPWMLLDGATVGDAHGVRVAKLFAWQPDVKLRPRSQAEESANAHLIAAAPDLYDGCNAVLGLIQLVLDRDDVPPEIREALTTSHRIAEAEAAVRKARGEA